MTNIVESCQNAIREGQVEVAVANANRWAESNTLEIGTSTSVQEREFRLFVQTLNHCLDENQTLLGFFHPRHSSQIYGRLPIRFFDEQGSLIQQGRTCPNGTYNLGWLAKGTKITFSLELAKNDDDQRRVELPKPTGGKVPTYEVSHLSTGALSSDQRYADIDPNQFSYEIVDQGRASITIPAKIARNDFGVVLAQAASIVDNEMNGKPVMLAVQFDENGIYQDPSFRLQKLLPEQLFDTTKFAIRFSADPLEILENTTLQQIEDFKIDYDNLGATWLTKIDYLIESKKLYDEQ